MFHTLWLEPEDVDEGLETTQTTRGVSPRCGGARLFRSDELLGQRLAIKLPEQSGAPISSSTRLQLLTSTSVKMESADSRGDVMCVGTSEP